jgi:glyoxalase family protein
MTTTSLGVHGLHHITVIAGDAQENLDFYVGVLGMRLVKRSVNQDSPGTYHLFYADAEGHPGTDLTFFPWPDLPEGRPGTGLSTEVALAVPAGSLDWWRERLARHGVETRDVETRFGERVLPFSDPHGLRLVLVETADPREFTAWAGSPVPAGRQVLGLHGARIRVRDLAGTAAFLERGLGFAPGGEEENGWHRFRVAGGGSGRVLDVQAAPGEAPGRWGRGSVHHLAWRVADDEAELEVRRRVAQAGARPTEVIDRFWFRSVYFKEPGGVLFELATDGPGFAVDEAAESLGESLVLPPWLEPERGGIERALPPLRLPAAEPAAGATTAARE